nr:MAG TPA: holin [Caudoviricetes sp.]
MKDYIINDKLYHVLKWLGLIACPAAATFIGAVFPAWGIPNADAVVLTLNATGVLIGALIGVSAVTSKQVTEGGE